MRQTSSNRVWMNAALALSVLGLASCSAPQQPEEDIPTFTNWKDAYHFAYEAGAKRKHPIAAEKVYEKWLPMAREEGKGTSKLVHFLTNYAYALSRDANADKNGAKIAAMSEEALAVADALPANAEKPKPITYFMAAHQAGSGYLMTHDYAKSEQYFRRAIDISKANKNDKRIEKEGVANAYKMIIEALKAQNKEKEADAMAAELKKL